MRSSLTVAFYSTKVHKFNVGAIPFLRPFNIIFDSCGGLVGVLMREVGSAKLVVSNRYLPRWVVGRNGRGTTYLVYCNTVVGDRCDCVVEDLMLR